MNICIAWTNKLKSVKNITPKNSSNLNHLWLISMKKHQIIIYVLYRFLAYQNLVKNKLMSEYVVKKYIHTAF